MAILLAEELTKTFVQVKKAPGIGGAIRGLFSREKTEVHAVAGISLEVQEGELVGFLGPNGAGKTTTIKMLAGILHPTSGRAEVLGYRPFDRNPDMLREISLVMGNKNQLWWDLPAWDSFVMFRELYDVGHAHFKSRIDELVTKLDLSQKIHTQVRKLSLGERMKCELVAALLHRPRVLFLDEPTIGLDLVSQLRIREFLMELNRNEQTTIILTSHYMQDVKELCDRVIIIDHGRKVFDDPITKLTDQYASTRNLRLTLSHREHLPQLLQFGREVESTESTLTIAVPSKEVPATTARILSDYEVADIAIEEVSLDEIIRNYFSG